MCITSGSLQKKYWKAIHEFRKYEKSLNESISNKINMEKKITKMKMSIRKGSLRGRDKDNIYATEEELRYEEHILAAIEKDIDMCRKYKNKYYDDVYAITYELNNL